MARNEFTDSVLPLVTGAFVVLVIGLVLVRGAVKNVNKWENMGKATARTPDPKPTDERRPSNPWVPPNPKPEGPGFVPGGPVFTPSDPAGVPAATAAELIGQWSRAAEGLTEVWTVQCPGGRWEVSCRYFEGTKEVGSFVGLDAKVTGSVLSFTQRFDKQPPRPWPSGATITAQVEGGKLAYTWRFGGSSGTNALVRVERPGIAGAPAPVGSELIGKWIRRSDNITEVWNVRCSAGKWEVSCQYFEGTKEVVSFVGSDVQLSGSTLSFIQQYDKPPLRPLQSGSAITARVESGKLLYTWKLAGGGSGTHPLVRAEE